MIPNPSQISVLICSKEPFQYLLNVHWCWIQPLFNFVYRPAFTRKVALEPH